MRQCDESGMRIGYVIWSLGLGGAEQVVIRLARAMQQHGHYVVVITLNEPGIFANALESAGIRVISIGKRAPADVRAVGRLANVFREQRLELVHTHLWGANLWGRLAAKAAGVRAIVTEHNVDDWKRWHHRAIDKALAGCTDSFVAVSQQVRHFYEARGIAIGRWQVIYNGIDVSDVVPRRRPQAYAALGIDAAQRVVGWVGRLVAAKAPDVFLEAIAKAAQEVPNLKALIVGDGPLREEAQAHAHRLGIDGRVVFAGLRSDVPELLAGMDVLAFSSLREGLSMAMLEAMAAGVPLVATRVGGTPELIDSGRTGILVSPNNPQELADRLIELLQRPEQAEAISRQAREHVESHFSLRTMVDAHEAVYCKTQAPPGTAQSRRVCYVIDHLGLGGAQRQLVELVKRLPRDRWEPIVISLSDDQDFFGRELARAGITVHAIRQQGAVDAACFKRLAGLLRAYRPAIVHTLLFTADTYGRIAARWCGIRRVACAIRNTIDDMPWRYRLVNRWLAPWTSRVTINVNAIRPGLIETAGIPERKIRTIYNGIVLEAAKGSNGFYRDQWRVPEGGKVIAMVARMNPQKDYRTFLKAAQQVVRQQPKTVFLLVGDGEQSGEIRKWVGELGLAPVVRMLGQRQDVRQLLGSVDVCVLVSHYEGCSNAIMEAMAAGKPVVATRVGGNPELVVDGETGILIGAQDADALALALLRLLADASLRESMGCEGRKRIAEHFSLDSTCKQTLQLYEELLAEEGGA